MFLFVYAILLFLVTANTADAVLYTYAQGSYYSYAQGSYYSYSQGSYYSYSQSSYYSEASYQTTFTTNTVFSGDLNISGHVSKGSGTFVIDHPLDPENRLLYHSFVESPDVKNIYDGIAELDQNGEAKIELPSYFEALNKSYRYQVKPIGAPAPDLYIKEEILSNSFVIAGGEQGIKVSWQVTGIRQDPYILANPIIPEVEKGPEELVDKGEYIFNGYEEESIIPKVVRFFKRVWYR